MSANLYQAIFISSTQNDLEKHRQAVRDIALRMDFFPIMMEYFAAMDRSAVELCMQEVDKAAGYIGLFAHRYGYIPEGYDISITELEFDRATVREIPRLCFVVDEKARWPKQYYEPEPAKTKLQNFKEKKIDTKLIRAKFTTPRSLDGSVAVALHHLDKRLRTSVALGDYTIENMARPLLEHPLAEQANVILIIKEDMSQLDTERLCEDCANRLGIGRDNIRVLRVMSGSTVVELEIPTEAAKRLYQQMFPEATELTMVSSFSEASAVDIKSTQNPILLEAWRIFWAFDKRATYLKRRYLVTRVSLIVVMMLALSLTVLSFYLAAFQGVLSFINIVGLLVAAALWANNERFFSANNWIDFRTLAERIRSQIYLYRTVSGEYKNKTASDQEQLLSRAARDAQDEASNIAPPDYYGDENIHEQLKLRGYINEQDDGFSPINVEQYMQWRLIPQLHWYEYKIKFTYNRIMWMRFSAIVFLILGASVGLVPAYMGFMILAIGLSVTIQQLANVKRYGIFFGLFQYVSHELRVILREWQTSQDYILPESQRLFDPIAQAESLITSEIEQWHGYMLGANPTSLFSRISPFYQKTNEFQPNPSYVLTNKTDPDELSNVQRFQDDQQQGRSGKG